LSACQAPQEESTYGCDTTIDKTYFSICYNYNLKSALEVTYTLDGSKVYANNIEQRENFYIEPTIPREYAASYDDYRGSGYDRGHLASDASFDYSKEALYATYSLANIAAQEPQLNRGVWLEAEKLEREMAYEDGEAFVTIELHFSDNPQRIGEGEIAVATLFEKIIVTPKQKRCFLFDNLPYESDETLEDFEIECE